MSFARINFKSTTKMSLNDRFTGLRGYDDNTQAGLEERRALVQASRKNQRLAQQMENRPAVIAALAGSPRDVGTTVRGRGGMLRGARGARGAFQRGGRGSYGGAGYASDTPTAGAVVTRVGVSSRPYASGGFRGTRGAVRGFTPRGAVRGFNMPGAVRGFRGVGRGRGGGSMSVQVNGEAEPELVSVKQRLDIKGRLSLPSTDVRPDWIRGRGGYRGRFSSYRGFMPIRGRGAPSTIGMRGVLEGGTWPRWRAMRGAATSTISTGTFRTRGPRGVGRGRGRGRGSYDGYQSYSDQWADGQ